MLREAELFAFAEDVLVEVLGRIRPPDHGIVLPPLTDLPDPPQDTTLGLVVEQHAYDDLGVPDVLDGDKADALDRGQLADALGADPQPVIVRLAEQAKAAALAVTDGEQTAHARYGDVTTRRYLLRLAVNRALVAHYVAAYLGSTACPLPEELAGPLLELTAPDAARWRELGIFGEPMPVPHLASKRDTFLLTAGHLPHPLGH